MSLRLSVVNASVIDLFSKNLFQIRRFVKTQKNSQFTTDANKVITHETGGKTGI